VSQPTSHQNVFDFRSQRDHNPGEAHPWALSLDSLDTPGTEGSNIERDTSAEPVLDHASARGFLSSEFLDELTGEPAFLDLQAASHLSNERFKC